MGRLILRKRLPTLAVGTPAQTTYAAKNATASFAAVGAPGNLAWQAYNSFPAFASTTPVSLLWTPNAPGIARAVGVTPLAITWTAVTAVGVAATFNPATLSLTGWWRDYTGSGAWVSQSSAGVSGSGGGSDFADGSSGADILPNGTALNGHGIAQFDGTGNRLAAANTTDRYINPKALSGWALVKPTTGELFGDPNCMILSYGGLGFSANLQLNGGPTASLAATANVWQLVTFRYDGVNIQIGINGLPTTTVAFSSNVTPLTDFIRMSIGATYQGSVAEMAISDQVLLNADFTNVKSYINSRYALSL